MRRTRVHTYAHKLGDTPAGPIVDFTADLWADRSERGGIIPLSLSYPLPVFLCRVPFGSPCSRSHKAAASQFFSLPRPLSLFSSSFPPLSTLSRPLFPAANAFPRRGRNLSRSPRMGTRKFGHRGYAKAACTHARGRRRQLRCVLFCIAATLRGYCMRLLRGVRAPVDKTSASVTSVSDGNLRRAGSALPMVLAVF